MVAAYLRDHCSTTITSMTMTQPRHLLIFNPMSPQLVINEERIAGLVGQEVRVAVSSAVDAQLGALALPAETTLSIEQWQALGKRLTGMEQQLQVTDIELLGAHTAFDVIR